MTNTSSKREQTVAARIAKDKKLLLEHLCKTPTILNATKNVGTGRTTYYDWRKCDLKFAKAADEAITEGVGLMNDIAELQLLSLIKEKKFDPIRFWLTHRHPAYANKLEIKGSVTHVRNPLTPGQKKLVRRALSLATLKKSYGKKQ